VALVVFDERRPIDLSPLRRDEMLGAAEVTLLPGATVLRVPLAADRSVRLARAPTGWTVTITPPRQPEASEAPIRSEQQEGRLRLLASGPGQVVAVPDPQGGGTLLVGTQRGAGQLMPVERRAPEFALLATWQGVAVQPRSDALALRAQADGFVLETGAGQALAIAAPDEQARVMTEAAHASRRYDLPALPLAALHRRLQSATLAAAGAPTQARTAQRREVAEALMALAMGPEMQAVTTVAIAEDAGAAADPDMIGLGAIAALLAGRFEEAGDIEDPRLTGSDETALWRAVRLARQGGNDVRAAAIFASAMPLLLSYPTPLRDRILPLALETMAQGGQADAATDVAARLADMRALDLARGYLAERNDKVAALAVYDRVAGSSDRRARALAARRSVELRHAAGNLSAGEAAEALERLVYAWRGDAVEVDTRLRIAELRAADGAWRASLAALREIAELFPAQEPQVKTLLGEVFARSIAVDAQPGLSPIDLVALAEENADLMPTGPEGHALAERLLDRLTALDLPTRAVALLERLVADAPPGVGRAALGSRLAGLRLESGRPAEALEALSRSMVEGAMPPDLLEQRTLFFAQASTETGDLASALSALAGLGTPAALAARAALLEKAKDWSAAAEAWAVIAQAQLPLSGPLDEAQGRLLLRLVAATAQAGDSAQLARLRTAYGGRLPAPMGSVLLAMTTSPVQGIGDLARAGQEARLAAAVPGAFQALSERKAP
jgi:hypothetical protein